MPRWFRRQGRAGDSDAGWTTKQAEIVRAREARAKLLVDKEPLVADVEAILFRHDPIGINFDENKDEYRPEAETIVIRLSEALDEHDLLRIVHEEFVRWFSSSVAGGLDRYADIAHEIWIQTRTQ